MCGNICVNLQLRLYFHYPQWSCLINAVHVSNIEYVSQIVHFIIPYKNLHTQRYNFFSYHQILFKKSFQHSFVSGLVLGKIPSRQ